MVSSQKSIVERGLGVVGRLGVGFGLRLRFAPILANDQLATARITNSTLPRQDYKIQKVYPEIIAEVYQCIYGEIWGTSFDSGDVDPGINVNLLLRNAAIQPQLSEGKGKFATRLF